MVASSRNNIHTDSLIDWLTLYHAPGIGPASFHKLLEQFGDPTDVLNAASGQLQQIGLPDSSIDALRQPDSRSIERDLDWQTQPGNRILTCRDPDYPALLQEISDPPPLLYIHGNVQVLREPQLAIVGSRNPTAASRQTRRCRSLCARQRFPRNARRDC